MSSAEKKASSPKILSTRNTRNITNIAKALSVPMIIKLGYKRK